MRKSPAHLALLSQMCVRRVCCCCCCGGSQRVTLVHPHIAATIAVLAQLLVQYMQLLLARRLTFLYWKTVVLARGQLPHLWLAAH